MNEIKVKEENTKQTINEKFTSYFLSNALNFREGKSLQYFEAEVLKSWTMVMKLLFQTFYFLIHHILSPNMT